MGSYNKLEDSYKLHLNDLDLLIESIKFSKLLISYGLNNLREIKNYKQLKVKD